LRTLGLVANVDDDQLRLLDAFVALGNGPVLRWLRGWSLAHLRNRLEEAGAGLLEEGLVPTDKVGHRCAHQLLEQFGRSTGLAQEALHGIGLVPLFLGAVALVAHEEGRSTRRKRGRDVHAEVHNPSGLSPSITTPCE
jgi:hypothetical protein